MTDQPQSAIRNALGGFAPKLVTLTEEVLFGDVWERTDSPNVAQAWTADDGTTDAIAPPPRIALTPLDQF